MVEAVEVVLMCDCAVACAHLVGASGALAPETLQCLPLGHVARQLNGENELWMATAFSHAAVQVWVVICRAAGAAHNPLFQPVS